MRKPLRRVVSPPKSASLAQIRPKGGTFMKSLIIGTSGLEASEISLGCMRIGGMVDEDVDLLIRTSVEAGINFFDHADIYAGGKSEEVFSRSVARLGLDRSKLILQSKCGIRK